MIGNIMGNSKEPEETNLVGSITASANCTDLIVEGLDIKRDGWVYDIVVCEAASTNSTGGHLLMINNLRQGHYHNTHIYNKTTFGQTPNTNLTVFNTGTSGFAFTNGFGMKTGLFYTMGTITYFLDQPSPGFMGPLGRSAGFTGQSVSINSETSISIIQSGTVNYDLTNITSVGIYSPNPSNDLISSGSFIKVYKR